MAVGNICIEFNQEQLDELKSYLKKEIEKEIKSIESRPKGRWIPDKELESVDFHDFVLCSECSNRYAYVYNYCPYCGADMRGEEQ